MHGEAVAKGCGVGHVNSGINSIIFCVHLCAIKCGTVVPVLARAARIPECFVVYPLFFVS